MLPLGSLFLGIFIISILFNRAVTLSGPVLLYIGSIALFFVLPLGVILFLNPRKQYQTPNGSEVTNETQVPFLKRPIGALIPIIILVAIGLIPLLFFVLIVLGGLSER